jgi:hypothetical protein
MNQHAMQYVSTFLTLPELAVARATCRLWNDAVAPYPHRVCPDVWISDCNVPTTLTIFDFRRLGIGEIVNVDDTDHPKWLKARWKAAGIQYRFYKTHEVGPKIYKMAQRMREVHKVLIGNRSRNIGTLVHCHAGKNRSVTCILYHMLHQGNGESADQVLARLRLVHPIAAPMHAFRRILGGASGASGASGACPPHGQMSVASGACATSSMCRAIPTPPPVWGASPTTLYEDALHAIYAFLTLPELIRTGLACRSWYAAAIKPQAHRPLSCVVIEADHVLAPTFGRSPFFRHIHPLQLLSSQTFPDTQQRMSIVRQSVPEAQRNAANMMIRMRAILERVPTLVHLAIPSYSMDLHWDLVHYTTYGPRIQSIACSTWTISERDLCHHVRMFPNLTTLEPFSLTHEALTHLNSLPHLTRLSLRAGGSLEGSQSKWFANVDLHRLQHLTLKLYHESIGSLLGELVHRLPCVHTLVVQEEGLPYEAQMLRMTATQLTPSTVDSILSRAVVIFVGRSLARAKQYQLAPILPSTANLQWEEREWAFISFS